MQAPSEGIGWTGMSHQDASQPAHDIQLLVMAFMYWCKRPCFATGMRDMQPNNTMLLTVRPAVPMASSIPTLAAGSMTLGSLVMPGKATDSTTQVLISACKQLSIRGASHSSSATDSRDENEQEKVDSKVSLRRMFAHQD